MAYNNITACAGRNGMKQKSGEGGMAASIKRNSVYGNEGKHHQNGRKSNSIKVKSGEGGRQKNMAHGAREEETC